MSILEVAAVDVPATQDGGHLLRAMPAKRFGPLFLREVPAHGLLQIRGIALDIGPLSFGTREK